MDAFSGLYALLERDHMGDNLRIMKGFQTALSFCAA